MDDFLAMHCHPNFGRHYLRGITMSATLTKWELSSLFRLRQVSLLLLTFMSVERFVSISHPFGERKLTFRTALVSVVIIWSIGFCLSIIPGER